MFLEILPYILPYYIFCSYYHYIARKLKSIDLCVLFNYISIIAFCIANTGTEKKKGKFQFTAYCEEIEYERLVHSIFLSSWTPISFIGREYWWFAWAALLPFSSGSDPLAFTKILEF